MIAILLHSAFRFVLEFCEIVKFSSFVTKNRGTIAGNGGLNPEDSILELLHTLKPVKRTTSSPKANRSIKIVQRLFATLQCER